jgi:ankyrin repeat protein
MRNPRVKVTQYIGFLYYTVAFLLEHGPLHGAEADAHYDFARLLLHEASLTGRADVVHLLLWHNAEVDAGNISNEPETPLHYASLGQTRAV